MPGHMSGSLPATTPAAPLRLWAPASQECPLTTLVLVTFNKVELTLQCLESVYAHTEAPFEVVVVDNASSDSTVSDLRALGKDNLTVIANPNNDGFGRGCNIGADAAKGEFILFLNNDTLVCAGWLKRMLRAFEVHPALGMVGPITNVASNTQRLDHQQDDSLAAYAQVAGRLATGHAGELCREERLIGFCLLLPRTVWDEVGGFDERYGIGHYEDDDLSAKIAKAGFALAVTTDVYIYHFAGQSFDAAGIAKLANARKNAFVFYQKWGNAYANWPHLALNLSELVHVVAAVESSAWSPPSWHPNQAHFLVSAASAKADPAVDERLRQLYDEGLLWSAHTTTRPCSAAEALDVALAGHQAARRLWWSGPPELFDAVLAHAKDCEVDAVVYRSDDHGIIGYAAVQAALDRVGGFGASSPNAREAVESHVQRVANAGLVTATCEVKAAGSIGRLCVRERVSVGALRPLVLGVGRLRRAARRVFGRGDWRRAAAPVRMRDKKIVNITMLSFNRLSFTKRSIEALYEYTSYPFRLVVVDNGSDAETVAWLKESRKQGLIDVLILNAENRGVATAANQGWRAFSSSYYVKLDNDIVIQKSGWLAELVRTAEMLPEAGMVGYNFEECSYPLVERRGVRVRPRPLHLGGACILIGPRAHDAAGYWCEDYFPYSEEDYDMGYRLERAGFEHFYLEDEDVGLHLPKGRATRLEEGASFDDENDPVYRAFKDAARSKHIGPLSTLWINRRQYVRGTRSLRYVPGTDPRNVVGRLEARVVGGIRRLLRRGAG
jgi:GT2 family glycosyltransferase